MFGITLVAATLSPTTRSDGAVTEINAEAYFLRLEAAAMIAAVCEHGDDWSSLERSEATALRTAILAKLFNEDTSAFVLNYDQDGNYQDNFTADEVFPVLFDVADEAARKSILKRLLEPDFVTPVGLRTISTADSWYFPSHGFGLLGGVWPDLTLWFAVALARNGAYRHAVHFLEAIYASMEAGTARNTVPGQFGEWFDGGSLTNRGMYLSAVDRREVPLEPSPRRSCGIDGYRTSGRLHLVPRVPPEWLWTAAARVHWGGERHTYVMDHAGKRIVGDMPAASADEPYAVFFAGRDVSDEATVSPVDVAAIARSSRMPSEGVRMFVWQPVLDRARNVAIEFRGRMIRRRIEAGAMLELVVSGNPQLVDAMPVPANA